MELFDLVLASLYNNSKSLYTHLVTKQELPKVSSWTKSYVPNWFAQKGKKMFAKAASLVDKILSCPGIKLLNSPIPVLDGVETGVLQSGFAQQLRLKNIDVPDIYSTWLDDADVFPTLVLNPKTKAKERDREREREREGERERKEAGTLPKYEHQKLQRLKTQGAAAYGSVRILVNASNLPVSKVRKFLHSKLSYMKFTLATHKL